MKTIVNSLRLTVKRVLDILFPRQCVNCHEVLSISEDVFCGKCLLHMPRTNFHLQKRENELAKLFYVLLPIENATAWIYYSPNAEHCRFIRKMKYYNRPDVGEMAGRIVATEIKDSGFFDGIDCIIPIPLSRRRQWKRGYNQSKVIAEGVSEITSIPIFDDVVRRKHFHKSQTHLNVYERRENVKGAFELVNGEKIRGRHILLIDDIVTFGSTIISCGEELIKAGNVKISVLTLGYTT